MAISEIPDAGAFVLRNCSVPTLFLAEGGDEREGDLAARDVHVAAGENRRRRAVERGA